MIHEVGHSRIVQAAESGYLDDSFKEMLLHLLVDIRDALEQDNAERNNG